MAEFDNTNRGALFSNKEGKSAENHPDYKGSINAAGVDYWLSAWLKTSKDGKKYMSLSITPKEAVQAAKPAKPAYQGDTDGDIPF
jgi:uncharacterized protein (DUF736 family)